MPVIENAEITGIEIPDGRKTRVLIESIFLLPEWIKWAQLADLADCGKLEIVGEKALPFDEKKQIRRSKYNQACKMRKRLWRRLKSAAVQARRRGVEVLGLGALLSTVFNGGADLQRWCNHRNLGLTIDNGAAYTAVATVEAVEREYGKPLSGVRITVFGGTGFIGRITVKRLVQLGAKVIVIGRDKDKLGEFDEGVIASADPTDAYGCNIFVLVTSSEKPIITLDNCTNFRPDTLFVDTAVPVNFDDAILEVHPEMRFKLVRGGVTLLPGKSVSSDVDMHFGETTDGIRKRPACLAETVMSHFASKEERALYVSCGARVTDEAFNFYAEMAQKIGLVVVTNREFKDFAGIAKNS
jgi:predicted amino acid dehydrogenase